MYKRQAVASPNARPIPKIAPAKIPDFALAKTTLKFVCVLVAPNANDPNSMSLSTALIAVIDNEVIVGKIIMASNKITANNELPPAVTTPNIAASELTSIVIVPDANTPYTTDGIEASNSTTAVINPASFLGAILVINKAVNTDNGKDSNNAPNADTNVLMIINPTP